MSTKLTGLPREATPVVGITQKVGGTFVGILQTAAPGREVKMRRGKGYVFEFAVKDSDLPIDLKDAATGKYLPVEVAEGAKVSIFAPTILQRAFALATIGDVLTIKYLGKKAGKNGDYHDFDVTKD